LGVTTKLNRDGTPLPAALSGNVIERLIRLDEALMYLVGGALEYLCDREKLEQTGTLTVDDSKLALSDMLWAFYTEQPAMIPVGATMIWHTSAPPTRWLLCTGGVAYVADYPELFALWGYKYGASGAQFGLPDIEDFLPIGAGGIVSLDGYAGEAAHTLTAAEMPSHKHTIPRATNTAGGTTPRTTAPNNTLFVGAQAETELSGGGLPHNNIPPVFGVNFIVYGGRE
jgi:microcystin-dependent protein